MNLIVKKTIDLQGKALIPGSKSLSIRGLFFALLAQGESVLHNILESDDTMAARSVCHGLGATLIPSSDKIFIQSNGLPLNPLMDVIQTGNSGISTLFTLPLLGLRNNCKNPIIVNCDQQMRQRPIKPLIDALKQLGMTIHYLEEEGKLPISVMGALEGGNTTVDGFNSQYLSALLISLPCAKNKSIITVNHLHERPYVNMTLSYLKQQGIQYHHEMQQNTDIFTLPGNQVYTTFQNTIQGDFSSASCLIAASVLLGTHVELQGLYCNYTQGDQRLIDILQAMGADITIKENSIMLTKNYPLQGIRIDANDIPDLLPALAVIGTQALGKTEIVNVPQARIKETDRIRSMTEGLRKMGARIDEHADGMTIYHSQLHGTALNGYQDHRTVMALTVAGMLADGTTIITDREAITKTYPTFVHTMQQLGANIACDEEKFHQHIILIGFKNVGKTSIGRELAACLNKPFIDLDREVEKKYNEYYQSSYTCRQIMQQHGEAFYREYESSVLKHVLEKTPCIISLGGGTVLYKKNQDLLQSHCLLHIAAPKGIVFERIMVEGLPAFFDPNKDPYDAFCDLWDERNHIYQKLTNKTVNNHQSIHQAVSVAIQQIY